MSVDPVAWLGGSDGITVGTGHDDRYFAVTKTAGLGLYADLVAHFFLSELCETWWGCQSIYRLHGNQ
ncbi:hypothetical protein [Pseudonocardia sp.]|jgi:hypothetical protein|uniref:hypothetical protein n=1 Tax=Pseudonocardia sp. TaxID=60912 RepID=UPI0031FE1DFC